jgi:hypothetical protein
MRIRCYYRAIVYVIGQKGINRSLSSSEFGLDCQSEHLFPTVNNPVLLRQTLASFLFL